MSATICPMAHCVDDVILMLRAWLGKDSSMWESDPTVPRVPLDERNLATAFGAIQSNEMDFSVEDRAPEGLLNEILWRSVKGKNSPMPPPRRSVFVRPSSANADDDDDGP